MRYTSRGLRRRRETDQWEVTLSHKDPITGEQATTYHTITAKTERQAQKRRDELIRELEDKGAAVTSKMTLGEFVDEFIRYKEEGKAVEKSTVNDYRKEARVLKRYLGDVRLADVTIAAVSDWMARMTAEGYAPRTVAKPFALLKQVMKYAMALDLVTKNPCQFCKPPKQQRKAVNTLNRAERTRMMELARAAEPAPLALAIEIALTTGLRRGEVCALRWSDLGEDGTLTVNRAVGLDNGGVYLKDPKSASSRRTIPLTPRLFAYLSAMKKDFTRTMELFGVRNPDAFILGKQDPKAPPYHPTRLTREFTSFCRLHGFDCTFHDLRHTFATMLISDGVDIRTVASYLGHSNVALTLNTYAEVDPEAKRAAVGKIQDAFDIEDSPMFKDPGKQELDFNAIAKQLEDMLALVKANRATEVEKVS